MLSVSHRTDKQTLRAILGNDTAIEAARAGKVAPWAEGSILAKVKWKESQHANWAAAIVPAEFEAAVVRKAGLTNALFNIRKAVASANATAGVNVILTDVERIDALIAIEQSVAVQKVGMSLGEINARLEKFRNAPAQDARSAIYGDRYNNVETSVVTEQAVVSAKQEVKNLRRQRQNLQDKLLALNINTNITLSAEDEAILREEGIV